MFLCPGRHNPEHRTDIKKREKETSQKICFLRAAFSPLRVKCTITIFLVLTADPDLMSMNCFGRWTGCNNFNYNIIRGFFVVDHLMSFWFFTFCFLLSFRADKKNISLKASYLNIVSVSFKDREAFMAFKKKTDTKFKCHQSLFVFIYNVYKTWLTICRCHTLGQNFHQAIHHIPKISFLISHHQFRPH